MSGQLAGYYNKELKRKKSLLALTIFVHFYPQVSVVSAPTHNGRRRNDVKITLVNLNWRKIFFFFLLLVVRNGNTLLVSSMRIHLFDCLSLPLVGRVGEVWMYIHTHTCRQCYLCRRHATINILCGGDFWGLSTVKFSSVKNLATKSRLEKFFILNGDRFFFSSDFSLGFCFAKFKKISTKSHTWRPCSRFY